MVRLGPGAAASQDRRLLIGSLALLVALAWAYLWQSAAAMEVMGGMPHIGGAAAFALTFAMWAVMMTGMMLPSAAPAIVLYSALVRKNAERGTPLPAAWIFTDVTWSFMFGLQLTMQLAQLDPLPAMAQVPVKLSFVNSAAS